MGREVKVTDRGLSEGEIHKSLVYRAVSNFMKNELLAGAAKADGFESWKSWLRQQFIDSLKAAFAGQDTEKWVERAIRNEVSKALNRWAKNDKALIVKIDEIIRDEVKAHLKANLQVNATLTVDVDPKRYEGEGKF